MGEEREEEEDVDDRGGGRAEECQDGVGTGKHFSNGTLIQIGS